MGYFQNIININRVVAGEFKKEYLDTAGWAFRLDPQDLMESLYSPCLTCYSTASGINDLGEVVGAAYDRSNPSSEWHAVRWGADGKMTDLGINGDARGINDRGQRGRLRLWS